MTNEFVLPEKWCIKATDQEEAEIIAQYADPLNFECNKDRWVANDSLRFWLSIENGKFIEGYSSRDERFSEITFEQFLRHVLHIEDESISSNDYTYLIKLFKKLNIQ
jgi:hypothetical protein